MISATVSSGDEAPYPVGNTLGLRVPKRHPPCGQASTANTLNVGPSPSSVPQGGPLVNISLGGYRPRVLE